MVGLGTAMFVRYYKQKLAEARKKELVVTRTMKTLEKHTRMLDPGKADTFYGLLAMDQAKLEQLPVPATVNVYALYDYVEELIIPPQINMEEVIVTLMANFGLRNLAPLTAFLPEKLKTQSLSSDNSTVQSFIKVLSPTILSAISQSIHTVSKSMEQKSYGPGSALYLTRYGSDHGQPGIEQYIKNPFVLDTDLIYLLTELDLDGAQGAQKLKTPQPNPLSDAFFPGLYLGMSPGVEHRYDQREIIVNRLICQILNRLASNAYPTGLIDPEDGVPGPFAVQMTEQSPKLLSPEALLAALVESGHSVSGGIFTNITAFGINLSTKKADGTWADVPVAIPIRTGVRTLNDDLRVETTEISNLIPHSAFFVDCTGPLLDFRSEFFQGIDGFTGWNAPPFVLKYYQNHPEINALHGIWSFEDMISGVKHASHIMNIYNYIATKWNLPVGGYGYSGVCLDSVALVQHSVKGETTVFPIMIGGGVKVEIAQAIQDFFDHVSAAGQNEYKSIMRRIVSSLRQLPCDVLVEPHELEDACIRMMKTIPEKSPFKVCVDARNMAQRVLDTVKLHRTKLTVQNQVFIPN
ncbi:hypothetical protein NDN08_003941 [Rhodosorus marinus]|uniref:Uncharacterized protein n=1 Tax=Rhodosorus marinus TaxID=101924 RepID=A0AAV8UGV9_9RHOD|nr:hypothetical protein NDN08_003941 [Rhodosorus marinus]